MGRDLLKRYGFLLGLLLVMLSVLMLGRNTVNYRSAAPPPPTTSTPTLISPNAPTSIPIEMGASDTSEQVFDLSNVPIREDTSISPALNPSTFRGKKPEHGNFETYTVVRGDTPVRIAEKFGIKDTTLLGGNPHLSEEAGLLQVDDELIILPVDGLLHDVRVGDTLESISAQYNISVEEIIGYEQNNLEFPYRLYADSEIMLPGAVRELFQWDPPQITTFSSSEAGGSRPLIVGTGTYVWPVSGRQITQVYWAGHPAIDVGLPSGNAVYASDTGTVTYAAWSPYCYGNLIVVNHGNGNETFYAHLSGFNVSPGQIVYQGNVIGYSGNTGCSSGPHIHFEIRISGYRDNPLWLLP